MTPKRLRRVQLAMLGVLAAVAAAVALTLAAPRRPPAPPATLPVPEGAGRANSSRTGDLVYRIFRKGRESLVVQAEEMLGSEQDELHFRAVRLGFPFVARGEAASGTLTAAECRYVPATQKAQFRGDVVLTTSDGFELRSEALLFRADTGIARGEDPLTFRRKGLSGRATGFIYHSASGTVELLQDVHLTLADTDQPTAEIHSQRAVLEKDRGTVEFQGGVHAAQGGHVLEAETYYLEHDPETQAPVRGHAYGDVRLTLGSRGSLLPGAAEAPALRGGGVRVLRAARLDLSFGPDRRVREMAAGPEAELRLLPGPGDEEGPRTLRARVLTFRFDDVGRLREIQGQKESWLRSEAPAGSGAPPLEGSSRSFLASLDPATGEVQQIDFQRDVEFTRGTQRAAAGQGRYLSHGVMRFWEQAEARDTATRTLLSAGTIDLHTQSGDLEAREDVRHTIEAGGGQAPAGGGFLGGGVSTLVVAREFRYTQSKRESRYEGNALLRAGSDEVRAERLTLTQKAEGQRVLLAEGDVASRLQTRDPPREKGGAPVVLEARAGSMLYDEGRRRLEYRGDVTLRRERLVTRSPRADLLLSADGRGLRELVLGEPVELADGPRRVTGARAVYRPDEDELRVEGDDVLLSGPGQQGRGRALTLHLRDDRIEFDGAGESRTETVFRKEPRKP